MIGSIRGKVILRDGLHLLVETNGVGYRVLVSEKISSKALIDTQIFLFIYSHIRDDVFDLFGFLEIADLKLFENLISVSGVGPKTAMSIFSVSDRNGITNAVIKGDVEYFTQVPRLGKKNAQKIIIELKNRLGDTSSLDLSGVNSVSNEEIFLALKTFGFSHKEIVDALKNIDQSAVEIDEKIKLTLKYLGK